MALMRGRGIKGGFSCDDTNVSSIDTNSNSKAAGQQPGGGGECRKLKSKLVLTFCFVFFFGGKKNSPARCSATAANVFFIASLDIRICILHLAPPSCSTVLNVRHTFFSLLPPLPSWPRYRVANYQSLPIAFPRDFSPFTLYTAHSVGRFSLFKFSRLARLVYACGLLARLSISFFSSFVRLNYIDRERRREMQRRRGEKSSAISVFQSVKCSSRYGSTLARTKY